MSRKASLAVGAMVVLASALVGLGAVYVTLGPSDNASAETSGEAGTPARVVAQAAVSSGEQAALPSGPGANPLSRGGMATFVFKKEPEALTDFVFVDESGTQRSLKDWQGKVVLLNLWATWCAPCGKEMPALDRLQKELGSDKFEVVALSVDRAGVDASRKFLDQTKVEALRLYVDPTARAALQLKALGLPATLLLDRDGREIGRLMGPAEWDGDDARRLIRAVLG